MRLNFKFKHKHFLVFTFCFIFFLGSGVSSFAVNPIPADPLDIIDYQRERWRDRRFEVFSWDRFPELIIFDTANYDVQSRLFKRLAFFAEKAGFKGRLAHDAEIANLHGWNAHDYEAKVLADFFETARVTNFPLLQEERELLAILLAHGVLRRNSVLQIIPGKGGVLSISRDSDRNLRLRFMAHEGFHGIYYVDEGFRNFTRQRWEVFPNKGKMLLLSFFVIQAYDIADIDLVHKEFSAHVLYWSINQVGFYYGDSLPNRVISANPLYGFILPASAEVRGRQTWPELAEIFIAEAEIFSNYVNERWNFSAGRVWRARPNNPR